MLVPLQQTYPAPPKTEHTPLLEAVAPPKGKILLICIEYHSMLDFLVYEMQKTLITDHYMSTYLDQIEHLLIQHL